jgi:hypothetical protein
MNFLIAAVRAAKVSCGSKGEVRAFNRQVGFTPNSGHGLAPRKLTLCADARHRTLGLI